MTSRLRNMKKSLLFQNAVALYGVQIANYIIPLITIPYLTRVLKPDGWGGLAFVQSLGLILITVSEYGFSLSVSRDISIHRDDPAFLKRTIGSVTFAKILILFVAIAIIMVSSQHILFLRTHKTMLVACLIWASAQGMSPLWLYQGLEKMRISSATDFCFKATGVVFIFFFVKQPSHGFRVFLIYGIASCLSTISLYTYALSQYGFGIPSPKEVLGSLRQGLSMFVLQASVSLYTTANAFILGLLASPYQVGIYSGAERISKSLLGLLGPINQALYPRMNITVKQDKFKASALARKAFYWTLYITAGIALFSAFAAPPVVGILLGKNFHSSIGILRILLLLLPIIGASNMLGMQWMLPLRMDRAFTTIVIVGGAVNLLLASLLARRFQAYGMAISVVCAELMVTLGCLFCLSYKKVNPLSKSSDASRPPLLEPEV